MVVTKWRVMASLPAVSELRPGMLLSLLGCVGQHPQSRKELPGTTLQSSESSTAPGYRLRAPPIHYTVGSHLWW